MEDHIMIDPRGAELYADDAGKPCLRIVEALGRIANGRRIGGCGSYIERWTGGKWEFVDGPFFGSLGGPFSEKALEAFAAHCKRELDNRKAFRNAVSRAVKSAP